MTSTELPQSATLEETLRAEFTKSGSVLLALAARRVRPSRGSILGVLGPRPQARRLPAVRRSGDGMTDLLHEMTTRGPAIGPERPDPGPPRGFRADHGPAR